MNELSVALVGLGATGQTHLSCWNVLSGVTVTSIADSDASATAKAALRAGNPAAFTSLEELLAVESPDIIDICLPVNEQSTAVRLALAAGANVICDAPFTGNSREAAALGVLANARERMLIPALSWRFDPLTMFAEDLLTNDDIGRPLQFRCRLSSYDPSQSPASNNMVDPLFAGADLFRHLIGELDSARLQVAGADAAAPHSALLNLTSKKGMLGTVECCNICPGVRNYLEIYATAGACLLDFDDLTLTAMTADQPIWRRKDAVPPGRTERMLSYFADTVRGIQEPILTAEDAVRALTAIGR